MAAFLPIIRIIDRFTEFTGKLFGFLVVPLMLGLVYEVFSRYFLREPTIWAYDVAYMLYGTLFMLGAAYTLFRGGHIRTDMIYRNLSPRRQGLIDAVLYLFFFFPGVALILVASWDYAHRSWVTGELAAASPWRPPIYPFKAVIPLAAILLLIQGVSELLKSIYAATTGAWPAEHHEEEVLV